MVGTELRFSPKIIISAANILSNPYNFPGLLPEQGDSPSEGMKWQKLGYMVFAINRPHTPRILDNKPLILTPIATASYFGFLTKSLPIITDNIYSAEKETGLSKRQKNAYEEILGMFLKLKLHEIAELERNGHKALAEKLSHNLTIPTNTVKTFRIFLNKQSADLENFRRIAERESMENEAKQYSELLIKLTLAQEAYDIKFPQ
jgi:hypothetical protein